MTRFLKILKFSDSRVEFYENLFGVRWVASLSGQNFTDGKVYPNLAEAIRNAHDYLRATSVETALLDFLADALDERGLIEPQEYRALAQSVQSALTRR